MINSLYVAVKRKRINRKYALGRIKEFLDYEIELYQIDPKGIFKISYKYDLTAYDASYIYLVKSENLPLLSLDEKLTSVI